MEKSDITIPVDNGFVSIRVGAIIMKDGKFLMVGNSHSEYLYSVGGRVKFGESAEEAVAREVLEETGVQMEVERLGFIHENFFIGDVPKTMGKPIYEISFYFYMKTPDGFCPECNSFSEGDDKEHLVWITPNCGKKYYPEFFIKELVSPSDEIKHFVTRDFA